jgi:hypothetical protein
VQISMPGTSWALAATEINPDASTASAATIRPIIGIFMLLMFAKVNLLRARNYREASGSTATISY